MLIREYYYLEQNGFHFPDTSFGSKLPYTIDLSCWLETEGITNVSDVTWECMNHLDVVKAGVPIVSSEYDDSAKLATVIVQAPTRGTYRLRCTVTAEYKGTEVTKVILMALKIY